MQLQIYAALCIVNRSVVFIKHICCQNYMHLFSILKGDLYNAVLKRANKLLISLLSQKYISINVANVTFAKDLASICDFENQIVHRFCCKVKNLRADRSW